MKKALVTGSAGYIGSHMVAELTRRKWAVDGFDITTNLDAHHVFTNPVTPRYDLVVHAAYHVGGREGIDGKNTNFAKNVALDGAMFDWAVRTKQRRVLYFSSSAVYPVEYQMEESAKINLRETDVDFDLPMLPDAGYGWAKLTGERLAADARRNGLQVSVVRPASGCSVDQPVTYPFPAIAARVAAQVDPLTIWGPPGQARDFVHVNDVIEAALAVASAGTTWPVNICTGRGTTFGELASMLWTRMHGHSGVDILYDTSKPTGVYRRVLNPSTMLNFYQPKFSIDDLVAEAAKRYGY